MTINNNIDMEFENLIEQVNDTNFDKSTNLQSTNAKSWLPIAAHIVGNNLIGVRLFGMFDDLENGVIVYEPTSFSKLQGEWSHRSLSS